MKKKSNLHYTRGITPKRVNNKWRDPYRGLAPGKHSSEEMWRGRFGDPVSDLTCPGI